MSFFTAAVRRVVNHRRRALTRAFSDHARILAHEVHGAPFGSKVDADASSTIFILHGLMGAGRNWRSFAKQLRQRLGEQEWRVVLVDLRGHGASASIGQGTPAMVSRVDKHVHAQAHTHAHARARERTHTDRLPL